MRCLRWRHAVDFRWTWRKRERGRGLHTKPAKLEIATVCNPCRKEQNKLRYHRMSPEDKKAWSQAAARRAREGREARVRLRALERQNKILHRELARFIAQMDGKKDHDLLPLTPFRMWLVAMLRVYKDEVTVAKLIDLPTKHVREFLNGYRWIEAEGELGASTWCQPEPIHTVHIRVVDAALINVGESLENLYPYDEEPGV